MQDQPQLEAWIGTTDTDTVTSAQLDGIVKFRMIIAVEYRPNLVLFERVSAAITRLRSDVFRSSLRNRIGNTNSGNNLHSDKCALTGAPERPEIGWFRITAFAVQYESPFRPPLSSAPPQIGRDVPSAFSSSQGRKSGRRRVLRRSGPAGTPSPGCRSGASEYRSAERAASPHPRPFR